MCDLFAASARHRHTFRDSLTAFSLAGFDNRDGWGIGYHDDEGFAHADRQAAPAFDGEVMDTRLESLASSLRTRQLIAHLRFASIGQPCDSNCHPYSLEFLGRQWLFAHNGTCSAVNSYETAGARVADASTDSARAFEFLRDQIVAIRGDGLTARPLFPAIVEATARLLDEFPNGGFNFLLSSHDLLVACVHHRPFWVLRRPKATDDVLVMTTVDEGLTDGEDWQAIGDRDRNCALLLFVVGGEVVAAEEIVRGQ
jgi:predicted glutamine amidotransferase